MTFSGGIKGGREADWEEKGYQRTKHHCSNHMQTSQLNQSNSGLYLVGTLFVNGLGTDIMR